VMDSFRWWIGDSEGDVLWTNDRGETAWNEITLPTATAGALTAIQETLFRQESR